MKGSVNLWLRAVKRPKRLKKVEKTFWFCDCFINFKDGALNFTAVKREAKF